LTLTYLKQYKLISIYLWSKYKKITCTY